MATRRDVLKLSAVGGMVAVLPVENFLARFASGDSVASRSFAAAMPRTTVLRPVRRTREADIYDIRMVDATAEIVPGLMTGVRAYNGAFPGATIRATRDRLVIVRQTNALAVHTSAHLHGGAVPAVHDGHPMDMIMPGASREYRYPNIQQAAGLWLHDHAHEIESENVYRGLHMSYIITDDVERALRLPRGRYEVELQIRDARVETDGTLTYGPTHNRPHILVNGKERPHFRVAARKYRFRVYNVSVDRFLSLRLADGSPFVQLGTDGGFLAEPVALGELTLSGAERADVVVDFSRYQPGTSVVLQNTAALSTENADVMRFDVVGRAHDDSRIPTRLVPAAPLPPATVERRFVLQWNEAQARYTINGLTYDPDRVDVRTRLGTTEIWTIHNADVAAPPPNFHLNHSFHTHLAQFRVLDRNGVPVPPEESGRKDTVMVAPGDTVRFQVTWSDFTGRFVVHCHQLPHSTYSQMATIEVGP